MGWLRIYADSNPSVIAWESRDSIAIAAKLGDMGVRFERWQAAVVLPRNADDSAVMAAYGHEIERLKSEEGYKSVDVLRVLPDNPKIPELRKKFLSEHTHAEDEVRFFVEGEGMFYLRIDGNVYMTLCERGDLIGVPDGVRHWFDTSAAPCFTAIRFFTNPDGWVAQYTGDEIADKFPKFEKAAA